jgi:polysaccharide export outer membrane protein
MHLNQCVKYLFYMLALSFFFPSCINTRKTTYFNALADTLIQSPPPAVSIIHKNDLLSISVSSSNPDASKLFNDPNLSNTTTSTATGTTQQMVGYLVTEDGSFKFPELGPIKAEGLTVKQLSEFMTNALIDKKLLVDPIVTVRFINFRVTVLGEVNHPTVITVPNERISILEALGLAGDLTIYGKRDNVLLIREENDGKLIKRIDLNSKDILSSPYYYLQSNDVVYVEANKNKVASVSNGRQLLPVIFSALAFLTTVAYLSFYTKLL